MIDGVVVTPLRQILDERGKIMHMLKATDPHFEAFGEIYFSVAYPGVVKGWHIHSRQVQNYAVVSGEIRLVMYDQRDGSPSRGQVQELRLGGENYNLVRIPTGVYNGFKALGTEPAMVANCATVPHEPDEISRLDPDDESIPYDWEPKPH